MDWQTFKFWFGIALLFVVFGTLAFFIARWLEIENRLAFLGVLIAAYVILSMTVGYMRRRLRSDLEEMPAEERKASMASNRDARFTIPKGKGPSVRATLWVGLICINGMVIPLLVGPLVIFSEAIKGDSIDQHMSRGEQIIVFLLLAVLGFVIAWIWWSVGVTVWRRWAAKRGVDMDELQYLGENASLLWPEGHFFEKTELGNLIKRWRRK